MKVGVLLMTTCGTHMSLLPLEAVPNDITPPGDCSRFVLTPSAESCSQYVLKSGGCALIPTGGSFQYELSSLEGVLDYDLILGTRD